MTFQDSETRGVALSTTLAPHWPRLAWLAVVSTGTVDVTHGPFVVVDPDERPRFVAACVWDGAFAEGAFHLTPHVFGSGVRVANDGVHFVPSCTTVDRLFYVVERERVIVSNSLPILLGKIEARLAVDHDYAPFSESSCFGVNDYTRQLRVSHPEHEHVLHVMYDSLVVGGGGDVTLHRRYRHRTFNSVPEYLSSVSTIVASLLSNARAPERQRGMRAVTNASRGYDSAAVSAIVSAATPATCYTAARSNTRIPKPLARFMDTDVLDDDGTEIAQHLGLQTKYMEPVPADLDADLERWLWASGQVSPELIFWNMFADAGAGDALTLWFAGYFGDGMWDTRPSSRVLAGCVARGMPSGYGLAEARIRYGMIDCSLPYLFAEDAASVHALSLSAEMAPWRLDNDYDRPIPRRILEERGIAREAFGYGKKAVAQDFDAPQGDALRDEFQAATGWSAAELAAYRATNLGIYSAQRLLAFIQARGARGKMFTLGQNADKNILRRLGAERDLRRQTFVHCVNTLAERYAPT